jgi:hypothetical protein
MIKTGEETGAKMNEKIRRILVYVALLVIAGAIGAWAGYTGRAAEVRAVEDDLRSAVDNSLELGKRLDASQGRVRELEGIAEERLGTIRELEKDLRYAIARARERDLIIAELEARVGSLTGSAQELGSLAAEGRAIVTGILEECKEGKD